MGKYFLSTNQRIYIDNRKKIDKNQWTNIKRGIIKILAKGVRSIGCFRSRAENYDFARYCKASKGGLVLSVSRKLNVSIDEIVQNLYGWYTKRRLDLIRSPSKVLFYSSTQKIEDDVVEDIYLDLNQKLDYRIEGFDRLVRLIESRGPLEKGICEHLGVEEGD